jgi:hypothetical protein
MHGVTDWQAALLALLNDAPTWQGTHSRSLVAVGPTETPVPGKQSRTAVQAESVVDEKVLGGQLMQTRSDVGVGAPPRAWVVPGKHERTVVQAVTPAIDENVPAGQSWHVVCSTGVPAISWNWPGMHEVMFTQDPVWPASGCVVPSGQGTHSLAALPSRSVVPG